MNFKIGDKVKVNKWVGGIPKDFNGIGEVISINTNSPYPIRVNIGYDIDYGFKENEIELYKEEEKIVKFKVGDKVKLNENYVGSVFDIGDIGEVVEIDKNSPFPVKININGLSSFLFTENELDLYKETNFKQIEITQAKAKEIMDNGKPLGTFWFKEDEWFIAIDNTTGEAFTEAFATKEDCIKYLTRENMESEESEYKAITINNDGIIAKNVLTGKSYEINNNGIEEVKEDKMEKTFKEVIADIKEGESWESEYKTILKTKDMILISDKNGCRLSTFGFCDNKKFKLKRKEYTFGKAFKAYEEGKEIESCSYRYKKIDNKDYFYSRLTKQWEGYSESFDLNEIRGKWYIN